MSIFSRESLLQELNEISINTENAEKIKKKLDSYVLIFGYTDYKIWLDNYDIKSIKNTTLKEIAQNVASLKSIYNEITTVQEFDFNILGE